MGESTPLYGCLLRFFWVLLGPGLLMVTGLMLLLYPAPIGSAGDFFLGGTAVAAIAARLLDPIPVAPGAKEAGDLGAASRTRYVVAVVLAAAGIFVAAHFFAAKGS